MYSTLIITTFAWLTKEFMEWAWLTLNLGLRIIGVDIYWGSCTAVLMKITPYHTDTQFDGYYWFRWVHNWKRHIWSSKSGFRNFDFLSEFLLRISYSFVSKKHNVYTKEISLSTTSLIKEIKSQHTYDSTRFMFMSMLGNEMYWKLIIWLWQKQGFEITTDDASGLFDVAITADFEVVVVLGLVLIDFGALSADLFGCYRRKSNIQVCLLSLMFSKFRVAAEKKFILTSLKWKVASQPKKIQRPKIV